MWVTHGLKRRPFMHHTCTTTLLFVGVLHCARESLTLSHMAASPCTLGAKTMSDDAKTLLHYVANWRIGCADDSDRALCFSCARNWAAHIISA